ncbi:MAG: pantetheine-phosphate adenylyltransferase [Paludibacteraceae bacterium]|nr:pantetheine-phosphate adenylyltransferase [Paludibacteraceae bacterium]
MKIAIFTGSFDPFTIGHKDVVDRALSIFDKVVIAFGVNLQKEPFMPIEERMERVRKVYDGDERVEVTSYQGLTIDLAKRYNTHYIIKGVRNAVDFEYERNMAEINRRLGGLETVLLFANDEKAHVSSSLVRELVRFGKPADEYIV